MNDRDHADEARSGHTQPLESPVQSERNHRAGSARDARGGADAGRGSGRGKLGHVQPDTVEDQAPLRNSAAKRKSDEPTLPSNDASLNTKI